MKKCELCKCQARSYCESDEANLCWDCDAKVHGANFLVARHARTLLCRTCQSLTPWKASGAKLGRTVSVCDRCVNEVNLKEREEDEEESEADNDENDDDLAPDGEDEVDADNQVLPWPSTTPPPATSSSSSSSCTINQECVSRFAFGDEIKSVKRSRESSSDLKSQPLLQDNINRSSSQRRSQGGGGDGEAVSVDSPRPLKERRTETERPVPANAGSRSGAIMESAKGFNESSNGKLKEESEAIDDKLTGNISRRI